jgi:SAM-dependent methyltransferase
MNYYLRAPMDSQSQVRLLAAVRAWWAESVTRRGWLPTLRLFLVEVSSFLRDSTPGRRRLRYGDAEYDWENRVDTTSATVGFRERLLGVFHSAYQPTDPGFFHQMVCSLKIDFPQFTFVDLGSGKGRTLLMAAEYPFDRIVGIELLPQLHKTAQENIAKFRSDAQRCFHLESRLGDATEFSFPPHPLVLYLFNPFPEWTLKLVMTNLARSLEEHPRPVHLLYHNALLEWVVERNTPLRKTGGTEQYSVYGFDPLNRAREQQKA